MNLRNILNKIGLKFQKLETILVENKIEAIAKWVQ
jgi:hypothetical protein